MTILSSIILGLSSIILGLSSIIVESSFYWRKYFRHFHLRSWTSRLRGRRSIWWGCRATLLALRIGNDVTYVTHITDDIDFVWQAQYFVRSERDFSWQVQHFVTFWDDFIVDYPLDYPRIILDYRRIVFLLADVLQALSPEILNFKIAWQAQYLVRLQGHFTCSAHWKWRYICDAHHWWHWFCVAGAVFRVAGAALRDILGDSRSANCCIFQYNRVAQLARGRSPKRRVQDDDFIVDYPRIILDYRRIVFLLAEVLQAVSPDILNFKIAWQAQYLVRLQGHFTCSAHWKWRYIRDAHHWWHWFCVAGAVFRVAGAALRDILGDSRDAKCCILRSKIVSKRRVRDDLLQSIGASIDLFHSIGWRSNFFFHPSSVGFFLHRYKERGEWKSWGSRRGTHSSRRKRGGGVCRYGLLYPGTRDWFIADTCHDVRIHIYQRKFGCQSSELRSFKNALNSVE